ncbi:inhibitor of nuclear factor kappa-B kinase subunit epsilon-like isoform X2 [Argonauta hians]
MPLLSNSSKMATGQLLKTTNHCYFKEDLVAAGSTCEVYKGYNKLTGEMRALKILNASYNKSATISLQRETEALLQLQHPNIVTFYSVERENISGKQVLVTEFCSGGTLSNFLREPENYNGLNDDEFLIFFRDIVCGMKHLRKNGFVHRDIKPPNILRCQIDRKTVYKLTDFGSAKPLQDEEEFTSLVGTEEYLHPDIYQTVFFEKSQHPFTASADLWSLGATLYHSASGLPPFIPYGGRKNRIDMYQMLTNKESGVVSGIQRHYDGDIEWSEDLPEAALMSYELRSFILPIIAGLLEKSPEKMWSFDKFFRFADDLNKKIHLKVVDTIRIDILELYMKPNECLNDIQKKLESYTAVAIKDQRLFYEGHSLSDSLKPTDPLSKTPAISASKYIILISNQPICETTHLHDEPEEIPEFGSEKNEDLKIAGELCEIASHYIREAKITNIIMKQICKVSRQIRFNQSALLDQRTTLLTGKKEWFFGILSATGLDELSRHIFEEEEVDSFINIKLKTNHDVEKTSQLVHKVKKMIEVCDNHANDLQKMCNPFTELHEYLYSSDNCFHENRCCNILTDLMNNIKTAMDSLVDSTSKQRVASYSKQQIKDIQKKQLYRYVQKVIGHVTKHCFPINEKILTLYKDYHKTYLESEHKLSQMYEEIKALTENIQELNGYLTSPPTVEKETMNMEKHERTILKNLLELKTNNLETQRLKQEMNELSEKLSELEFPTPYQIPDLSLSDSEV